MAKPLLHPTPCSNGRRQQRQQQHYRQQQHALSRPAAKAGATRVQLLVVMALLVACARSASAAWHDCSSQAMYGGVYGMQLLANLTSFRSRLLSHVWSSFNPSAPFAEGYKRFDAMQHFITCPPEMPLKEFGTGDGKKVLCDMGKLKEPCVIYSLGSNGDFSFERDALKASVCEVHTFDCTYNGKSLDDDVRHQYHKTCIGSQDDPNFKTWADITRELGHHMRGVDVAKIDIEGHESSVLAELRHDVPLPQQIVMEMHIRPPPGVHTGLAQPTPRTPAQIALLFLHLANLGYGVTNREDNLFAGDAGCCAEFAFLRVERKWHYGARSLRHRHSSASAAEHDGTK